ncbi:MAG: acyltransferase [Polyangiales bacterium]
MRPVGYAHFLEGIRGLAALYVVFHHAVLHAYDTSYDGESLSPLATFWLAFFNRGDLAVALFIVLSGYCLMLPVVTAGRLRGGVLGFLKRRAQRILPAYYATIALVLGLLWLVPSLNRPDATRWDLALPALDPYVITSHLLLLHNVSVDWIWKLDGPLWSVAVEWQMYLLFPALIALYRRFGTQVGTALAIGLGYGLTLLLLVFDAPLATRTCPWYIGLFALGMTFAVRVQSPSKRAAPRIGWLGVAACFVALAALVDQLYPAALERQGLPASLLIDPLIALALGSVILQCSAPTKRGRHSLVRDLLESPALLRLGAFSYSLYLLHDPLISFMYRQQIALGLDPEMRVWVTSLVTVPIAILAACLLYAAVEKPLLPRRPTPVVTPRAAHAHHTHTHHRKQRRYQSLRPGAWPAISGVNAP